MPDYQCEDSFHESLPIGTTVQSLAPLEYYIIEGYSYTVKRTTSKGVHWQCTQQNPKGGIYCKATVFQRGDTFEKGHNSHDCQTQPGIANILVTKSKIKETVQPRS